MPDGCEGCGRRVRIAGGIGDFWSFSGTKTEGMTLEFEADGTEHFLCFRCIETLPDDPVAADVAAIPIHDPDGAE